MQAYLIMTLIDAIAERHLDIDYLTTGDMERMPPHFQVKPIDLAHALREAFEAGRGCR